HVHRIVEVRLFGEGAERLLLHAFEIQFVLHSQGITSARLPFSSSQSLRSEARFFASIMSMMLSLSSLAEMVSCTRRRVRGSMVVSRNCDGFISPRPLNRC